IAVKVIAIDEQDRVKVSRRALLREQNQGAEPAEGGEAMAEQPRREPPPREPRGERGEGRGDRGERGGRGGDRGGRGRGRGEGRGEGRGGGGGERRPPPEEPRPVEPIPEREPQE